VTGAGPPPAAYTDRDLVIAIPALGRAHLIEKVYASARTATPNARVVFACTKGDDAVIAEVERLGGELVLFPPRPVGDYANKINGVYLRTREKLIFTGATDIVFHPGWFEAAVACLTPGIGVVGTNDLGSPRVMAGEHSTHSLVTRAYADRPGATADQPGSVLYENYVHEWVDDELVGVAIKRGTFRHAAESHVVHWHPNWRPEVPVDPLYAQQQVRMRQSAALFRQRRHLWA
jgi:hypothetical protein